MNRQQENQLCVLSMNIYVQHISEEWHNMSGKETFTLLYYTTKKMITLTRWANSMQKPV